MFSKWRGVWRVLALGELVGFIGAGLAASVQFAALHVTWIYLLHNPDLVLRIGSSFLTDSLISGVLLVALLITVPVLVVSELVSMRAARAGVGEPMGTPLHDYYSGETRRRNAQRVE